MRTADVVTAALLILVGGVVIHDAVRLGIGWGDEGPRSGFFPFWLATLLVVVSGAVLVQSLWRASPAPFATRAQIVPVLQVLLPVAGFVVLTDPPGPWPGAGLYVAAGCYLAFYMRWVGRHAWTTVALVGTLVPIAAFVVFEQWFLVPMPKGPLETMLGY